MPDQINDGGPAYPCEYRGGGPENCHQNGPHTAQWYGMTLRQWYAGEAMKAILSSPIQQDGDPTGWLFGDGGKVMWNHTGHCLGCHQVARLAREMADALIAELKEK